MPKFIIERRVPDAGSFPPEKLKAMSKKSLDVLNELGTDIQWIHSYVAGDKIYCIFRAPTVDLILEHARLGGFPADSIEVVSNVIESLTAE